MADDELPPDAPPGLFTVFSDAPPPEDEPPEDEEEIHSVRRLNVVRDAEGNLPDEGAEVIAFRNSNSEPVVVPTAVATEAERAFRCYRDHISGKDWHTIATEQGYPSPRACKADVDRYLEEARSLVVEKSAKEMLRTEISRLDMLQTFAWESASKGSIPAISEIRQLVMGRAKLVAYLNQDLVDNGDTTQTVVVPGEAGAYVATLKTAAGNAPAGPE
jgi:hypothetical protein